ncbi:MAG: hypothetical protein AAGF76_02085 [Pseudomonadota bacterium]
MDLSTHSLGEVQTISDLRAVAREPSLGVPAAILALGVAGIEQFEALRRTDPRMMPVAGSALHNALMLAMVSPQEDPKGATLATATFLTEAIEAGDRQDDWLWIWDSGFEIFRAAPAPIRAALMNGFRDARRRGIAHLDVKAEDADCITGAPAEIIARLVPLARSMTHNQRRSIAALDYGKDIERHLAALDAVLSRPDCIMTDEETWYPSEVVELVTHSPDEDGFEAATALLLIQSVSGRDTVNHAGFRWGRNHHVYKSMEAPWRRPILDAFRYCYEAFDAFSDIGADGHMHLDKRLPWFFETEIMPPVFTTP